MWSTELKGEGVTLDNHQKASVGKSSKFENAYLSYAYVRWHNKTQSFDKPMTSSIAISDLRLKVFHT